MHAHLLILWHKTNIYIWLSVFKVRCGWSALMAADVRPGQCLLVGALIPWIIENVDVQPQSTVPAGAGCLRWSPAVQSENSRSVLAGWLPLGDATSSLAGTDRSVTSLIRTQLHRHIKGFPPFLYQEWNHNPWDISAPAPWQKRGVNPSHLTFFLRARRRWMLPQRFWVISVPLLPRWSQAVLNYDNDQEGVGRGKWGFTLKGSCYWQGVS